MAVFLLFWVIVGLIAAGVANSRGQSGIGFFFLSLFLGPLTFLFFAIPRNNPDELVEKLTAKQAELAKAGAASDMRDCPYCAESIKAAAIKCRYCGSEVEPVAAVGVKQVSAEKKATPDPQLSRPETISAEPQSMPVEPKVEDGDGSNFVVPISLFIVGIIFVIVVANSFYDPPSRRHDQQNSSAKPANVHKSYRWIYRPTANIRSAPSANAKVLGQLSRGDEIEVFVDGENWVGFRFNDSDTAYVARSLTVKRNPLTNKDITVSISKVEWSSFTNSTVEAKISGSVYNNTPDFKLGKVYLVALNRYDEPIGRVVINPYGLMADTFDIKLMGYHIVPRRLYDSASSWTLEFVPN